MAGHAIANKYFKNQQLFAKYSCLLCKFLLKTAVQSALCGHWFCEACIARFLKTSNPICPRCKENLNSKEDFEGGPGYFPDKFVRRDIDALELVCMYRDSGCDWEGTFGKLEGHLANCDYAVCGKCQERLPLDAAEHKCQREDPHVCPLATLGCTADDIGTKEKLDSHMQDPQFELFHSRVLVSHVVKLENTVKDLKEKVTASAVAQKYPEVEANGQKDSGFGSGQFRGDMTERDSVPVKKSASRSGEQPEDESDVVSLRKELRVRTEEIASLRALVTKLEKVQRSKNADFEDRDFRLSLIENGNYDGSMIWKIPQFSQRMVDAQSGKYTSIFSLPFYTGRYGYKMCLRLYILGDGIGKGNYMSLFFVLMKGEFDNILQWPFTFKVTFKLLNQKNGRDVVDTFQPDPASSSFRKPKSDMNIASGCPRFVSHTNLKSGGYIEDETVFIKCSVDVSTVQHP